MGGGAFYFLCLIGCIASGTLRFYSFFCVNAYTGVEISVWLLWLSAWQAKPMLKITLLPAYSSEWHLTNKNWDHGHRNLISFLINFHVHLVQQSCPSELPPALSQLGYCWSIKPLANYYICVYFNKNHLNLIEYEERYFKVTQDK